MLIDASISNFDYNTTVLNKEVFAYFYLDTQEHRVSIFKQKSLVSGLIVQACIDSALNANKCDGFSSIGYVVMVGNILRAIKV